MCNVSIANEVLMFFRSKKKSAQDIYISDPIDTDKEGNSLTLMDIVADEDNLVENLELKLQSEKLHKFISSQLNEREKTIVLMRYGLCGYLPMTQREVAKKLCISRSYVSRIEKKALQVLRKEFERV